METKAKEHIEGKKEAKNYSNNKITIVFVIGSLFAGGAERVITTLSNELIKNYNVVIITLNKSIPFYPLHKEVKVDYCKEVFVPSKNPIQAIKSNLSLIYKLSKKLKSYHADVVLGNITNANIITVLSSLITKLPCIISEVTSPFVVKQGKIWKLFRKLIYPFADCLIVQTDFSKAHFKNIVQEKKIVILPNPLSPELEELKNENHKKENIILNVGRLDEGKSQDLLIKAFSKVRLKGWRVILVGEGSRRDYYEQLVKDMNLQDHITFTGNVQDVSHFYNKSKIFAFTSKFEGFPNTLIEAMYYSLPCISTNCITGPSEMIENGKNGFLIPVGDQLQLENHLLTLMNDCVMRQEIGEKAYKKAKAFVLHKVVKKWDKLIRETIQQKSFN